jgi:signal transduction histidine kinase
MSRTWLLFMAVLAAAAAALVVTLVTPDTRVPVIDSEGFAYEEAERALEEVSILLADNPTLDVEDLEEEYHLLADIKGTEPAGLGWAAVGVLTALLGALAWTRADNRFGWYLMTVGAVSVTLGVSRAVSDLAVHSRFGTIVGSQLAFALADTLWIPLGVLLGPLLLLTFPNGRLPTRRWGWVRWVSVLATVTLFVQLGHPLRYDGRALAPYAGVDLEVLDTLFSAGIYLWMIALAAAGISLIMRFHRTGGPERDQLKWVTYGLVVSLVLLALSDLAQRLGGDPSFWGPVASAGFFVLLPLTFLFSVFRYRLFSIDVVINRTVVFGILSLLVAAVYVAAIAVAGSLVGAGDVSSALIAMVVTAFAFEPVRVRIESLVDRFVWRRGSDPRDALSEVFATVEDRYEFDDGMAAIVGAVAEATNARCVALWVDEEQDVRLVAAAPTDAELSPGEGWDHVASVGETGALGVRMSPGDRLRRPERRLVDDLARLAASLIENMRLRTELDDIAAELEARQTELIAAEIRLREIVGQTRTEVERDLHDGAQARAVALASVIGLARVSPSSIDPQMMQSEIRDVEEAVVSFANGLHPATLRTGGLANAIWEQARLILPGAVVQTEADGVPDEISAVAYLVATEGMLNVAKHARSTQNAPLVSCMIDGTELNIVVRDDGPGFSVAAETSGSGLTNIRERVEALGGSLEVDSAPGDGTNLRATISLTP